MLLDERRDVVVLRAPEGTCFVRRHDAVVRRTDVGKDLPLHTGLVHLPEPRVDVEPALPLRRTRARAFTKQFDDVRADPVRVEINRGRRRWRLGECAAGYPESGRLE